VRHVGLFGEVHGYSDGGATSVRHVGTWDYLARFTDIHGNPAFCCYRSNAP
jgi:hypothetical protein